MRSAAKQRTKRRSASIEIRLARLGDRTRNLRVPSGTAIKDLVKNRQFEHCSIRVNGRAVRLATKLKDGDIVVVTPQALVGSAAGRYDHLDIEECRRRMSPRDFQFFVSFVGADRLGIKDRDLEL